jgi:AcrR family transcriptional regulator
VRAITSAPRIRETPNTTRDVLVKLASRVFATEGYGAASVRDLGRRAGVTSGAIYGNFRGKADLLVEAVDARLTSDQWTLPDGITSQSLVDVVGDQFEHHAAREQLMSLLIEGAVAARVDPHVRRRLQQTLGRRMSTSVAAFEDRREAEGFEQDVDLETVVKVLWSIEAGLRVLAACGVKRPDPHSLADVVRRFLGGIQSSGPAAAGVRDSAKPAKKAKSAKPAKKARPGKKSATAKPSRQRRSA